MKEMHPDALPPVVESVNESMYRRIEVLHRGPPILLALADGAVWTTRELARFHAGPGPGWGRINATHQLLAGYAKRGLVERVEAQSSRSVQYIQPKLPIFGKVGRAELAEILGVVPSTIWRMRTLGRLPPPTEICLGHWSYWDAAVLREFFKAQGGFMRLYTFHCTAWRITAEGLARAKGKRR